MSIRVVEVSNLKGIASAVRVEMRPITLLFGANSAGKSSVLQALLYAREVLGRRNLDPDKTSQGGAFVDLGGFLNLVHNHDRNLPVTIKFELDLTTVDLTDYFMPGALEPSDLDSLDVLDGLSGDARSASVSLEIKWGEIAESPVQADYVVEINGIAAGRIVTDPDSAGVNHTVEVNPAHPWFDQNAEQEAVLVGTPLMGELATSSQRVAWQQLTLMPIEAQRTTAFRTETLLDEIEFVLASHEFPFPGVIPFIFLAPGEYLLSQLKKLRYLGPIREVPRRGYHPRSTSEESHWANGLAAWDWMHGASDSAISHLNDWLTRSDRLACGYRLEAKRYKELDIDGTLMSGLTEGADLLDDYQSIKAGIDAPPTKTRVILRREEDFLEVSPQDVGIGISQVVPVVVSAMDFSADRLTVIEQPELHIHPALQVALGDLFIEAASGDSAGQFLIETHSEHLLLRLLRRIRETAESGTTPEFPLKPDQVAVYFVEAPSDGTQIKLLEIDEAGHFRDRWPRGFFEEREKEFFGERSEISDDDLGRILGK